MKLQKNTHCSYCGRAFEPAQPWPRTCTACGNTSFLNPLPVAVALVPIGDGLLLVRRAIPPRQGELALPGGYINDGESWQQAAAREVCEETGLRLAPEAVRNFWVCSAPDSTLLVFGLFEPQPPERQAELHAGEETAEIVLASEPLELAFSLHTEALRKYFNG